MRALWLEGGKRFSPKIQQELGAKGITVTPVQEVAACLANLAADPADTVIIDLDLTKKGVEAVQEIHKAAPDIPVVVLASLERLPVLDEAFKHGAWDSVIKQLDFSHLYEVPRAIARCEEKKVLLAAASRHREEAEKLQAEVHTIQENAERSKSESQRYREEAERLQTEVRTIQENAERSGSESQRYREEAEKLEVEMERYREQAQSSQAERKRQDEETGWLGMALQACGDGIFAADAQSKLVFANPALRDLVGYNEEELIGKGIDALVPSLAMDDSSWTKLLVPFPQRRWQGKADFKKKDGSSLPLTTRIIQALDGKGGTKAVVGICLKSVEPEAKPALKTQPVEGPADQMVNEIIDDLQTPLAAMLGYLEIASTISPDQAEPNQVLSIKRSELMARRLLDLISSHIGAVEVDTKRLEIHKSPLQIDQILEPAVQARQSEANIKNIEIVVDIAKDLPPVAIDGVQIERAIGILLSNAINLSPLGGSVNVSVNLNGNEVALAIADSGSGLSPEELPSLFDRSKKLRRPGGDINTVGLYLAHQIVSKHGGRIDAKSELLEGTTLTIFLPR